MSWFSNVFGRVTKSTINLAAKVLLTMADKAEQIITTVKEV